MGIFFIVILSLILLIMIYDFNNFTEKHYSEKEFCHNRGKTHSFEASKEEFTWHGWYDLPAYLKCEKCEYLKRISNDEARFLDKSYEKRKVEIKKRNERHFKKYGYGQTNI